MAPLIVVSPVRSMRKKLRGTRALRTTAGQNGACAYTTRTVNVYTQWKGYPQRVRLTTNTDQSASLTSSNPSDLAIST